MAQQGDTSSPQENLIPQRTLPQYTESVLTLVRKDACKEDAAAVDGASLFQHAANNITDEAEVNLSFPVPPVQQHVSKNIQDGLDLWARIREYDQRMADEGFTQVLTKAQKQTRKKQVLGTSYQTRAKGALPSSK